MRQPLKQMSLPFLPANEEFLPKTAEELKALDPEVVAYLENKGRLHENFPEDSEAHFQFSFTGRKKRDREWLEGVKREIENQETLFP